MDGKVKAVLSKLHANLSAVCTEYTSSRQHDKGLAGIAVDELFWRQSDAFVASIQKHASALVIALSKPPFKLSECEPLADRLTEAVTVLAIQGRGASTATDFPTGCSLRFTLWGKTPTFAREDSHRCSGPLFERIDRYKAAPRSNAAAVSATIQEGNALVEDALQELQEEVEDAKDGGEATEDAPEGLEELEELEEEGSVALTLMPGGLGLLKAASKAMSNTATLVKMIASGETKVQDELGDSAQPLNASCDDLAITLYQPVDPEGLREAAAALLARIDHVLDTAMQLAKGQGASEDGPAGAAGGGQNEKQLKKIVFLKKASQHNYDRLLTALGDLQL